MFIKSVFDSSECLAYILLLADLACYAIDNIGTSATNIFHGSMFGLGTSGCDGSSYVK